MHRRRGFRRPTARGSSTRRLDWSLRGSIAGSSWFTRRCGPTSGAPRPITTAVSRWPTGWAFGAMRGATAARFRWRYDRVSGQAVRVDVESELSAVGARYHTRYTVLGSGDVVVEGRFVPGAKKLPEMPRFGMQMALPQRLRHDHLVSGAGRRKPTAIATTRGSESIAVRLPSSSSPTTRSRASRATRSTCDGSR